MRFDRLYIDPGSAAMGWAGVSRNRLIACGLLCPLPGGTIVDCLHKIHGASVRIVIERPVIYPQGKQKGDPNDLVHIAMMGGIAAGSARAKGGDTAQIVEIQPGAWKGQVPKKVMTDRILEAIPAEALLVFRECMQLGKIPGHIQHNVVDSIGLWLWDTEQL